MVIEKDDYFAVMKAPIGDRSYEGFIFRAEEVCGELVAALVVHSPHDDDYPFCPLHSIESLHATYYELMTVTPEYFDKVKKGRAHRRSELLNLVENLLPYAKKGAAKYPNVTKNLIAGAERLLGKVELDIDDDGVVPW